MQSASTCSSKGDGTFSFTPQPVINDFCYETGWRVAKHPRFIADVTGNGFVDIKSIPAMDWRAGISPESLILAAPIHQAL